MQHKCALNAYVKQHSGCCLLIKYVLKDSRYDTFLSMRTVFLTTVCSVKLKICPNVPH